MKNGVFTWRWSRENSSNKQATPQTKPELHPRKWMICIWHNWQRLIYYEMLQNNHSMLSCRKNEQTEKGNSADWWYSVIIQHEKDCPHITNITKYAIKQLSWEVIHPLYSSNLAPSDYPLFWSLSDNLLDVSFNKNVGLRTWIFQVFLKTWIFQVKTYLFLSLKHWTVSGSLAGHHLKESSVLLIISIKINSKKQIYIMT